MLFGDLKPTDLAARIAALVIALTVHEWAHAYSAYRLGDMTARDLGRLTLDPRRHLDPLGSLLLLTAGFGWAKPVPINPWRLGRWGVLWVSLAGPVSNLALAFGTALLLRLGLMLAGLGLGGAAFLGEFATTLFNVFITFVSLNVVLAVFNLLPLPPLDGSKVLSSLLHLKPEQRARYEQFGPLVLLVLVFGSGIIGFDALGAVMGPPTRFLFGLIQGLVLGGGSA